MSSILTTERIGISFGGLEVLRDLSINVEKNKITALIGPNGAGKTTLFNLLTGLDVPSNGRILFDGSVLNNKPMYKIACLGLIRSFQEVRVLRELTVLDNILIALRDRGSENLLQSIIFRKKTRIQTARLTEQAMSLLYDVDLDKNAKDLAANLSYGQTKLLEITRLRAMNPKMLLLDEPASGLNPKMLNKIRDLLLRMKETGITIFFIEHNISFVMTIADWVFVLDRGEKIYEGLASGLMNDKRVVEAYLGKRLTESL